MSGSARSVGRKGRFPSHQVGRSIKAMSAGRSKWNLRKLEDSLCVFNLMIGQDDDRFGIGFRGDFRKLYLSKAIALSDLFPKLGF